MINKNIYIILCIVLYWDILKYVKFVNVKEIIEKVKL